MNETSQVAERSRSTSAGVGIVLLIVGIAVGVAVDRAMVWRSTKAEEASAAAMEVARKAASKTRQNVLRQALVGIWDCENGAKTEFFKDGTFEDNFKQTVPNARPDGLVDLSNPVKTQDAQVRGQYEWVGEDAVEMRVAGKPFYKLRVAIEGDGMKLLADDGGVMRFTRRKG